MKNYGEPDQHDLIGVNVMKANFNVGMSVNHILRNMNEGIGELARQVGRISIISNDS